MNSYAKDVRSMNVSEVEAEPLRGTAMTEPKLLVETLSVDDLLHRLRYQTSTFFHTFCESDCGTGHWSRGGVLCSLCIDKELLRRSMDPVKLVPSLYARDPDGCLRRKDAPPDEALDPV